MIYKSEGREHKGFSKSFEERERDTYTHRERERELNANK